MRLIDAEELRKTMYHEAIEIDTDMQKWDGGCWIKYKMFENALENAPTIDAEPVRHGKWIPKVVSSGRDSWECSECGRRARGKLENLPYCHCGCKMDLDEVKG